MRLEDIDTPALLIDLDALEANLDGMAKYLADNGTKLRPHAKTHKSPVIARLQMARGATGVCVQKTAEAEVLAWGGVSDILVTNEVIAPAKLSRLAALAPFAHIALCADHPAALQYIELAAENSGVRLDVLVEVDVGAGRCGTAPGEDAVALARLIAKSKHLRFGGLQAYQGQAQHLREPERRQAEIANVVARVRLTVESLRRAGLSCETIGGGGTGTFPFEAESGVFTEIQAGSYCFMDVDYSRNLDAVGSPARMFRQSLFVLSSVMSVPKPGVAVIDAGHKAVAVDSGLPVVRDASGFQYVRSSDEHGVLCFGPETAPPQLGEKLMLIPGHCDPTVDRFDWYVGMRGDRVACLWPIPARGAVN